MKTSKRPTIKQVKRPKRPKSVLRKAWATRRAKKKAAAGGLIEQEPFLARVQAEVNRINNERVEATASKPQQDAVLSLLDQVRTEQLCSFVAEMGAVRRMAGSNYNPVIVSRMQAEAIEEFLVEHGYGPFGKGSGTLASVSTKPQAA